MSPFDFFCAPSCFVKLCSILISNLYYRFNSFLLSFSLLPWSFSLSPLLLGEPIPLTIKTKTQFIIFLSSNVSQSFYLFPMVLAHIHFFDTFFSLTVFVSTKQYYNPLGASTHLLMYATKKRSVLFIINSHFRKTYSRKRKMVKASRNVQIYNIFILIHLDYLC